MVARSDEYVRAARVVGWVDGDTVDVVIDCGFSIDTRQRVRVRWLNTPELTGTERPAGVAALNFAKGLAPVGSLVTLKSHKPAGGDKYGRYLADVTLADGRDYATLMVSLGHGKQWDGTGAKPSVGE